MEFRRPLYYFTVPGMIFGTIGLSMGLNFLEDFYQEKNLILDLLTNDIIDTYWFIFGVYRDYFTFYVKANSEN